MVLHYAYIIPVIIVHNKTIIIIDKDRIISRKYIRGHAVGQMLTIIHNES